MRYITSLPATRHDLDAYKAAIEQATVEELKTECLELATKIDYLIKFIIALSAIYALCCIIIAVIVSRILNKPISKLISDAEKINSENREFLHRWFD